MVDASVIAVLILGAVLVIGGPILGHFASKASEKAEKEEANKLKSK